jgi:hypothetical protein
MPTLPNPFSTLAPVMVVETAAAPDLTDPPVAAADRFSNPVAKATKGKAGTAEVKGLVRRSTAGTGLRVGEADADQSATSENGRDGGERPSLIKAQRTDVLGRAITPHGAPDEFLQAVILSSDTNECIRWPYAVDGGGYGQIRRNGRKELVHRIVCEKVHGPSPSSEHLATHTCGRGHEGCCSPLHLVWGTVVENAADRIKHGTHCRGERQWAAKLTAGDVIEIKRLAAGGMSQSAIANLFSVGQQQISAIILKKKWAWLGVTAGETAPNSRFTLDVDAFLEAIEPAPLFLSAPRAEFLRAADLMPVLQVLAGY